MPQPQTLKGFRDFLPAEKRARDFVAEQMSQTFKTFGFAPIETPTLEYASLLLGKYGDEADKLVYTFADKGDRQVGLRYDQTVPTARVLAQYANDLPRYFRRYQIQNVFRADKPQKGRFREFTQCDCDIFGSTSYLADAEIVAVFYAALRSVGFQTIEIQINDRTPLLAALEPFTNPNLSVYALVQTIDKLDKIGTEGVWAELVSKGLSEVDAKQALSNVENIDKSILLQNIEQAAEKLGVPKSVLRFNPYLARGLDYYTGLIFEAQIPEYTVGSVGGGGRYNNLIKELTGQDVPAVGFGIGFDRVVEAAVEQNLIPVDSNATQALVTIFSEDQLALSMDITTQLRTAGISTELYPSVDKFEKQLKLANQKQIPWVLIIGEEEAQAAKVKLKNMQSGEQTTVTVKEAISLINSR